MELLSDVSNSDEEQQIKRVSKGRYMLRGKKHQFTKSEEASDCESILSKDSERSLESEEDDLSFVCSDNDTIEDEEISSTTTENDIEENLSEDIRKKQRSNIEKVVERTVNIALEKFDEFYEEMEEDNDDDIFNYREPTDEELEKIKKFKNEMDNQKELDIENRIYLLETTKENKMILLNKLYNMHGDKEYMWLQKALQIPFSTKEFSLKTKEEIHQKLEYSKKLMDEYIHGQQEVKDNILDIVSSDLMYPNVKNNINVLVGPPGVGKTRLIKNCISKVLDRPLVTINCGGLNDVTSIKGSAPVWEGAVYGRIVEALITTKCNNPIIYFDELDKIDKDSTKSCEIIRTLLHIFDEEQNTEFQDDYFQGLSIDISKCLFIGSANDTNLIDPILKDRMKIVRMKDVTKSDKIIILKNYIIPEILKSLGYESKNLFELENRALDYLVTFNTRSMKHLIKDICLHILRTELEGTSKLEKANDKIIITKEFLQVKLKSYENNLPSSVQMMYM